MIEIAPLRRFNDFAWISFAASACILVGTFWIHAGLWPVRLSLSEAGFDKLESFMHLLPLGLIAWGSAIPSHPKPLTFMAAGVATVVGIGGLFAIG